MYNKKVAVIISLWLVVCFALSVVGHYHIYKRGKDCQNIVKEHQVLKNNYELLKKDYNTVNELYIDARDKYNELKVKNEREIPYTEDEVYLLAQCVEAEAGESNFKSQKYVTQVILNRVYSSKFPNTIKEVIYQKNGSTYQFSVAYNGAMNRTVRAETLVNVYKVLNHGTDLPKNVLFFYDVSVKNNWVNTLPIYSIVEGTVFAYSK